MPLYTFECPKCGTKQDELLNVKEVDSVAVYCNCMQDENGEFPEMKRVHSGYTWFHIKG